MADCCYRECPFSLQHQNLRESWAFSKEKMEILSFELSKKIDDENIAIMAAGSFGRYEAGIPSDLDFYILSMSDANNTDIMDIVSSCAIELGISLPNQDGVFSKEIPFRNILNNLGNQDESIPELAQRLLPLLESTPIYNYGLCDKITDDILEKYMVLHNDSPEKEALIMLNDIMRFFRYICANCQFKSLHDESKWALRNIKLRHSRVVMYAGLLFVILNSSKKEYRQEKKKYIKSMLKYTPLERVSMIMEENNHDSYIFLFLYDYFLETLNDEIKRSKLYNIEYAERNNHSLFGKLSRNSFILQELLANFVFGMRGIWSNKAMGYSLF